MLDNHPNIDCFSLHGTPKVSDVADTIYPQLKSLSISGFHDEQHHISFGAWAKQHIAGLRSLSCDDTHFELLDICSDTLTSLDLGLGPDLDSKYGKTHYFDSPRIQHNAPLSINFPPRLLNLTIRALIRFYRYDSNDPYNFYVSFLPAAIEILKTAPSMDCITLEINVNLTDCNRASFDEVDLSPLTALADSPRSFRRLDLHFNLNWYFTHTARLVSLLANVGGIKALVEQGVLVVHLNGTKIHF